jgi:hypothetical protein
LQFFAANPEEELTFDDLMVKFDCNRRTVYMAVYRLSRLDEESALESIHVVRCKKRPQGSSLSAEQPPLAWPSGQRADSGTPEGRL